MAKNNKPVWEAKIFPVKAAVWLNTTSDGQEQFYNVTIERTYKDGKGDYQSSSSFNRDDLLAAAKCFDAAHSWIIREEQKAFEAQKR